MVRELAEVAVVPEGVGADVVVLSGVLALGGNQDGVLGVGEGGHVAALLLAELGVLQADLVLAHVLEVHAVVLGRGHHVLALLVELDAVDQVAVVFEVETRFQLGD